MLSCSWRRPSGPRRPSAHLVLRFFFFSSFSLTRAASHVRRRRRSTEPFLSLPPFSPPSPSFFLFLFFKLDFHASGPSVASRSSASHSSPFFLPGRDVDPTGPAPGWAAAARILAVLFFFFSFFPPLSSRGARRRWRPPTEQSGAFPLGRGNKRIRNGVRLGTCTKRACFSLLSFFLQ